MTHHLNFSCALCNETSTPTIIQTAVKGDANGVLKVVRCPSCGHLQLNPPTYSLDYYNEDEQVNFVVHDYGTPIEKIVEHSWIDASRRLDRFAEKGIDLAKIAENKSLRVLDIGGGYGFFGSEVKRRYPNFDVKVLEPSSKRASIGQDYLTAEGASHPVPEFVTELINDDFVAKQGGSYDLVTIWHVLEHVPNPVDFLRLACKLVKPSTGIVCVEVPNAADELMALSPAFRDRNYMIEHISYFNRFSLETVARKADSSAKIEVYGYQRYGIFNYFHWIYFNKPQGANPDLFEGKDRWWLESTWRSAREQAMTSDALFMLIHKQ
jgi:2-polyprenyl-3-methyl-5-hydroxy-6-metoxy-1,4-benzoquinol methylase